jgi:hypothetical protein
MNRLDRWVLRITLPVIAAALAWQAWIRPSTSPDGTAVPHRTIVDSGPAPSARGGRSADASIDPFETVSPDTGTRLVAWDLLRSYEYQKGMITLPADIRSLDGQRVTMAGFLLPLYEFENIHEFALVGNHLSCCFGVPPKLNGVVKVRLRASAAGLANTSEPLRVVGTFRAKEAMEYGLLVSIYEIEDGAATTL